jgi:RimJ/RimL family protein N-acetyltransferase
MRVTLDIGSKDLPGEKGMLRNCLKHGFEKLNIGKIAGENVGSWRVLEKIGRQFSREELVDGHRAGTYELVNPSII